MDMAVGSGLSGPWHDSCSWSTFLKTALTAYTERLFAAQIVHLALRYYSLDSLQFSELNQKRACILVAAHVTGQALPSAPSMVLTCI